MQLDTTANQGHKPPHRIEINARNMIQLFNTMDPSPFKEPDIDRDAEESIVSWVREYPVADPVELVVYLKEPPADQNPQPISEQAMQHYIEERARINGLEPHRLFKEGQQACSSGCCSWRLPGVDDLIGEQTAGTVPALVRESLRIAGWVAM